MEINKKFLGDIFELAGFIFIVVTALSQASITGWWANQLTEWQYKNQNEFYQHSLFYYNDLADLVAETNQNLKANMAQEIKKENGMTFNVLRDSNRDRENEIKTGQASTVFKYYNLLVVFGAIFIAIGKGLNIYAKHERKEY